MYDEYKIVVYNDGIGRTCFGEVLEQTDTILKLKDPAMIMVTPNEAGQMKVDIIPLFFAEFIVPGDDGSKQCVFDVNRNNISLIDVKLTDSITKHYFTKINIKETTETKEGEEEDTTPEIKLFED